MPTKLILEKSFTPCAVHPGEELYRNGIFEFNVSRLLNHIAAHAAQFPIEHVKVGELPDYGSSTLDEQTIRTANLLSHILLVEISPGRFVVIDGNHRLAKARRKGVIALPARRVCAPHHIPFLTTTAAYEKYVEYWNDKLREQSHWQGANY